MLLQITGLGPLARACTAGGHMVSKCRVQLRRCECQQPRYVLNRTRLDRLDLPRRGPDVEFEKAREFAAVGHCLRLHIETVSASIRDHARGSLVFLCDSCGDARRTSDEEPTTWAGRQQRPGSARRRRCGDWVPRQDQQPPLGSSLCPRRSPVGRRCRGLTKNTTTHKMLEMPTAS